MVSLRIANHCGARVICGGPQRGPRCRTASACVFALARTAAWLRGEAHRIRRKVKPCCLGPCAITLGAADALKRAADQDVELNRFAVVTEKEKRYCSEIADRVSRMRAFLNENALVEPPEPTQWHSFLSTLRKIQGNLSNDGSFIATLLAKQ